MVSRCRSRRGMAGTACCPLCRSGHALFGGGASLDRNRQRGHSHPPAPSAAVVLWLAARRSLTPWRKTQQPARGSSIPTCNNNRRNNHGTCVRCGLTNRCLFCIDELEAGSISCGVSSAAQAIIDRGCRPIYITHARLMPPKHESSQQSHIIPCDRLK